MLSILVCHSYFLEFDHKQRERGKPYPPLATLQVAEMLRRAGHEVSLFDAMLARGVDDYHERLRTTQPQIVLLYEDTFNFLSKMCLGAMREAACEMIASARRGGARVIAAGPDVSDAPGPYLAAGAAVTLVGEGLVALFNVLSRLEREPQAIPAALVEGLRGAAHLLDGKVQIASGAMNLPSPQYTGFAAWDLVDMDRYRAVWTAKHGIFSLNLAASRGCSFRCAWCAKPTWGHTYLQRNARDVATEMAHLKRSFEVDHVWFADDIFGFRVNWVADFAAGLEAAGGGVPFTIQTRADLVNERMAYALADAGCQEAWLGAESGSQRVLDAMNKGNTVPEIIDARQRMRKVGIRVGFFIQLGYMGEDLSDLRATRRLIHTAQPDEIGVSVSYPLPGTPFHELVKAQLGAKTRWEQSSDLEMMFHGTYTTDFYREIRDLLHEEVRLHAEPPFSAHGAMGLIERRWRDLIDREAEFRAPDPRVALSG